jgi:hypothetical protein
METTEAMTTRVKSPVGIAPADKTIEQEAE